MTWGWDDKKKNNIVKFSIFKNIHVNKSAAAKENLLLLLRLRKRYFHSMESSIGTEVYSDFIKHCSHFLFNLSREIKSKTILRPPYKSIKIENIDFFSDLKNNFKFYCDDSMEEAYNKSKLIVLPSNSTPMLQSLSANLPTIIIFNKNTDPIRGFAKKYIKRLYENNVLFNDPLLAAKFVNKIWKNDIHEWWNKKKTQAAVKNFCDNFARKSGDITSEFKNIF